MNASPAISILLIADLTGSASLHQHLDAQEAERAIERCIQRMLRSLEAYDGQLLEQQGDEVLARFASVDTAVHAAVEMEQRIVDLPPVSGHKLTIRVALHDDGNHTGESSPDPAKLLSLKRIAGLAQGEQILCSAAITAMLADSTTVIPTQARPELGELREGTQGFALYQLLWSAHSLLPWKTDTLAAPSSRGKTPRLHLRYRDKDFWIDQKSPVLTMGRDASCNLLVEDRKVSRTHARIEKRKDGFYLIDTSTNGSFLSMQTRAEILVRRYEVLLAGQGVICFGSSANDPAAERVAFEHL
jgi:adenylate cyclase